MKKIVFLFLYYFFLLYPEVVIAASLSLSVDSPSSLTPDTEYNVNASLSINTADSTTYYLRGVFFKQGTNNYCGSTWNGSNYFSGPYSSNEGWKNFLAVSILQNSWSGQLKAKIDPSDAGCRDSGNYSFKVQRFTQSGSGTFDPQNELSIEAIIPTQTPTPTPSPTPTVTPTPTSLPTPTLTPRPPTATPTLKPTPTPKVPTPSPTTNPTSTPKPPTINPTIPPTSIPKTPTPTSNQKTATPTLSEDNPTAQLSPTMVIVRTKVTLTKEEYNISSQGSVLSEITNSSKPSDSAEIAVETAISASNKESSSNSNNIGKILVIIGGIAAAGGMFLLKFPRRAE